MSRQMPALLQGRRVTLVLNWAYLGGAERRALALARWLRDERGALVEVLALTEREGSAVEAARAAGIPWRRIHVGWDRGPSVKARELSRFVHALRRGRPDILVPFCSLPNVLSGLSWRAAGASTCIWHQADVNPFLRARSATRARAVRRTPVFVSNSDHGVEHLAREWGAPRGRILVAKAAVTGPALGAGRSERLLALGLGADEVVVSMVAHFRRSKDHATLLRAWRIVLDRVGTTGRAPVLLLAGDSYPLGDSAKALAFDLELERSVRFLGVVDDVPALLAASDVAVLSSLREGLPVSVLEAMAAEVPIVGTDVPGIREAVGPDGLPFLAPVGDADALADAILRLVQDGELRARLGSAQRNHVLAEFSPARTEAAYDEVFSVALAGSRRASR